MKNNVSIKDISIKLFNKNKMGERNSEILKAYSLRCFKKETMQSLGDKYGISKEAVRIILKSSLSIAHKESLDLKDRISLLSNYLNSIQLATLDDISTLLTNNGFYCSGKEEAALAVIMATEFGSNNSDFKITRYGCGDNSSFIFTSSSDMEKSLSSIRTRAIKEIKKCGGCDLSHIHSEVLKLTTLRQPSKHILKAILTPCHTNDIKLASNEFYFHTKRNKILSRVTKATCAFEFACPERLSDAINQSIQHRCKGATMISAEQLVSMITESKMGIFDGGAIHFNSKANAEELYVGELDIARRLRQSPGMELPEIENVVASKGLSKASVFQLCSISPLITKKGKRYYSI